MKFTVQNATRSSERVWEGGGGRWRLVLHWRATTSTEIQCSGVELHAMDPATGPVTASLWRQLRVREEIEAARAERYRELGGELLDALEGGELPDAAEVPPSVADALRQETAGWSGRRAGRPVQYDDEFYEGVAAIYREALAAGKGNPRMVVAQVLTVSSATASRYVQEARVRGLLAAYNATGLATRVDDVKKSTEGGS